MMELVRTVFVDTENPSTAGVLPAKVTAISKTNDVALMVVECERMC